MGVRIVWPDEMIVRDEQIIMWAKDAIANGEANQDEWDGTVPSAVSLLADIGTITPVRNWWVQ